MFKQKRMTHKMALAQKCISKLDLMVEGSVSEGIREENSNYVQIGYFYLALRKFKAIYNAIENIMEDVIHGIEGTFPDYYHEDGTDDEGKAYCPHEGVLYEFNETIHGNLLINLDKDVRSTMSSIAAIQKGLDDGFDSFFSDLTMYRQNEEGEMIPMTKEEKSKSRDEKYFNTLELSAIEITWTDDMKEIKRLAEQKGDLGKIIELL